MGLVKMLDKPIKININDPVENSYLDYEVMGKVIDNVLIKCENEKKDYTKPNTCFGISFTVSGMHEYILRFKNCKTMYMVDVEYFGELPKNKQKKREPLQPKDKRKMEDIKRVQEAEELKKKLKREEQNRKARERRAELKRQKEEALKNESE